MAESAPRRDSIRRTLLIYLGALSLIGAVLLFLAARSYGRSAADRPYDHLLVASALSIADSVALVDGQWQVDLPYAALDLLAMAPEDRVFYRVAGAEGATITGYADLPAPPALPRDGRPRLFVFRGALLDRDPEMDAASLPIGLAEEVAGYGWAVKPGNSGGLNEEPVKENDHSSDAARYMVAARDLSGHTRVRWL